MQHHFTRNVNRSRFTILFHLVTSIPQFSSMTELQFSDRFLNLLIAWWHMDFAGNFEFGCLVSWHGTGIDVIVKSRSFSSFYDVVYSVLLSLVSHATLSRHEMRELHTPNVLDKTFKKEKRIETRRNHSFSQFQLGCVGQRLSLLHKHVLPIGVMWVFERECSFMTMVHSFRLGSSSTPDEWKNIFFIKSAEAVMYLTSPMSGDSANTYARAQNRRIYITKLLTKKCFHLCLDALEDGKHESSTRQEQILLPPITALTGLSEVRWNCKASWAGCESGCLFNVVTVTESSKKTKLFIINSFYVNTLAL